MKIPPFRWRILVNYCPKFPKVADRLWHTLNSFSAGVNAKDLLINQPVFHKKYVFLSTVDVPE